MAGAEAVPAAETASMVETDFTEVEAASTGAAASTVVEAVVSTEEAVDMAAAITNRV